MSDSPFRPASPSEERDAFVRLDEGLGRIRRNRILRLAVSVGLVAGATFFLTFLLWRIGVL